MQGLVQSGLSGQAGLHLTAQQGHVLLHLMGVGVGEAGGILAELARHAGHDHLLHPVTGGDAQTVGDEIPDADEGAFRPVGQLAAAPAWVRPPVQKTISRPPLRCRARTHRRTVST